MHTLSRYARMALRLIHEGMAPLKAIDLVCRTYRVSSHDVGAEVAGVLHAE